MVVLLDNTVRSYPWGSPTLLPELLGVPASGEPQAELWLGAHPGAPSRIRGRDTTLADLVRDDPEVALGPAVHARFGPRLPFLLKVLGVERPLSIQAHPDAEQAAAGYEAENAAGVPLDAPHRTYRDPHHKPEMVVALSEFRALLGFREPAQLAELLAAVDVPLLSEQMPDLAEGGAPSPAVAPRGLADVVRRLLQLPQTAVASLVADLGAACRKHAAEDLGLDFVADLADRYPQDPGVAVGLLLEPVRLAPGDAFYLPHGTPHAYLRGLAVEMQASSDNTLRAGLTGKHVDVPALVEALGLAESEVSRLVGTGGPAGGRWFAPGPAELRLGQFDLTTPATVPPGPRIVLVVDGSVELTTGSQVLRLARGESAFVPHADGPVTLDGLGTVFVATTSIGDPLTA